MLRTDRRFDWRSSLRWTRMVAAGVVVLGVVAALHPIGDGSLYLGPRWLAVVASLLTTTTLFWCWQRPLGAVVFVAVVMGFSEPLVRHDVSFVPGFFVAVAVTAVAAYRRPARQALLALGITSGAIVAAVQDVPGNRVANVLVNVALVAVPWGGAWMLRVREQHAEALGARLATVEAEATTRHERAVADERARIARELHDVVAHGVSIMVIQTGAARSVLDLDPAAANRSLLTAEATGREALSELARLLDVLRSASGASGGDDSTVGVSPQPSLVRLTELAARTRTAGQDVGLDIVLDASPDLAGLPPSLDLCAYRIVQECLTNALRHADGGTVRASVQRRPAVLEIEVRNRVREPATERSLSGHGLIGIAERTAVFEGSCMAGPDGRGDWIVRVRLPLPAVTGAMEQVAEVASGEPRG